MCDGEKEVKARGLLLLSLFVLTSYRWCKMYPKLPAHIVIQRRSKNKKVGEKGQRRKDDTKTHVFCTCELERKGEWVKSLLQSVLV